MASSKSVDEHDLSQIVLRREEAFRHYFPTSLVPRETIGDCFSNETWDHVLDPQKPAFWGKFKTLEFQVEGLYRNSSQLDHPELKREFFSRYPVPLAPTEKPSEVWRVKDLTKRPYIVYNSYMPEFDLNRLVSELECARQSEASASNEHEDVPDYTENTAKQPASKETVVPSLASLAQAAVTKKTMHDSLLLEKQFSARLNQLRSSARQSMKETVSEGQFVLEESAEAQKVRELHQQLAQAEQALHDRQAKICREYQVEVDKIQHKYDQDRANAAVEYMKERRALVQQQNMTISHEGMAFCAGCAVPFSPRRGDVDPRDRCLVEGCQSGQFYCLDCANIECSECCAPVCLAHTPFHQFTCREETSMKRRNAAERKRKRLRVTSPYDEFMTPMERVVMSTRKWKREQEELHEKWAQNRLEAMTQDDYVDVTEYIEFDQELNHVSSFVSWLDGRGRSHLKRRTLKLLADRDFDNGDTAKFCPCGQCKLESRRKQADVDTGYYA